MSKGNAEKNFPHFLSAKKWKKSLCKVIPRSKDVQMARSDPAFADRITRYDLPHDIATIPFNAQAKVLVTRPVLTKFLGVCVKPVAAVFILRLDLCRCVKKKK